MKEIHFDDVDLDVLEHALKNLDTHWNEQKGIFEPHLELAFERIGSHGDYVLGVFNLVGFESRVVTLLLEYSHQTREASVIVSAKMLRSIRGLGVLVKIETSLAEVIANSIEKSSTDSISTTFKCPKCGARYETKNIEVSEDGQVRCQNCNAWVDWLESTIG
jgi:DNA-directed RNA polymerase subunit RPC12/RpoP